MKDPVRLLISAVAIATIGLAIAFLVYTGSPDPSETLIPADTSSSANHQRDSQPSDPKDPVEPPKQKTDEPERKIDEDDIAIPVEGNPLVVTLLNYPELGPISIEQYNNGRATGKPLKSGTQIQIPNRQIPGEKIIFSVP